MRAIKIILGIVILCHVASSPAFAEDVALFINDIGAFPAALGGAFGAQGGDVYSHVYNPGSSAYGVKFVLASTLFDVFGVSVKDFSFLYPAGFGTLSGSFTRGDIGGIPYTKLDNDDRVIPTGKTFSYETTRILFGWSDMVDNFSPSLPHAEKISIGAQIEYLKEVIAQSQGTACLFNIGGLYRYNDDLTLGVKLRNFMAGKESWSGEAQAIEAIDGGISAALKYAVIPERFYLLMDYSFVAQSGFRMGMCYRVYPGFDLVMGKGPTSWNAGINLALKGFIFNYSYSLPQNENFSSIARFSIGFDLGPADRVRVVPKTQKKKELYTPEMNKQLIADFARENDLNRKKMILNAITAHPGPEVTAFLIEICQSNENELVEIAANALTSYFPEDSILPLTNMLFSEDSYVRIIAARCLGNVGDYGVIRVLNQLVATEKDEEVKKAYLLAINNLQGK